MRISGIEKFGLMRQKTRRLLATVGVALLLGFQIFSAAYLVHEAEHDCRGEGCPICVQIQQCIAGFLLIGSGLAPENLRHTSPLLAAKEGLTPIASIVLLHQTLVSLKVQFNE